MRQGEPALLPLDPERLRVERGPVSLVIAARWGERRRPELLEAAGRRALQALEELSEVRGLLATDARRIRNAAALPPVARTMWEATLPYQDRFLTPLIAVAGAVADAVADFLVAAGATRALVNNGGDIAVRLGPGERARVGVIERLGAEPTGRFALTEEDAVGGIATSGLGGRSFTLGIADAVTVLGPTAAKADVAATLLANEVNVDSPAVQRISAEDVYPETDLRGFRVTHRVGELTPREVEEALNRGAETAREFMRRGSIRGALLFLRGERRLVGFPGPERLETQGGRLESLETWGGGGWKSARS